MKNILVLITLVTTQVLGDICLSQGMKEFGVIRSFSPSKILEVLGYIITSPWIGLGVSILAFSMVIYWVAISEMDISYVLPIHGSSYVLNGLMAWLILKEQVSGMRWLATLLIAFGVLIVGWSEHQAKSRSPLKKNPNSSLWIGFPLISMTSKIWLGAATLALADSLGDLLTAKGIKQIGAFPEFTLSKIFNWLKQVITNPYILGGISCQAISFLIFLSLLSWADISLVRPATAMGYIMSLLGAKFILHERITQGRLIGIIVIGFGIAIIS